MPAPDILDILVSAPAGGEITVLVATPDEPSVEVRLPAPVPVQVEVGTGQPGEQGLSAYQVALANGFLPISGGPGTPTGEEQWLASLRGADGPDGADGTAGEAGVAGVAGANARTVVLTLAAYLALDAPTQMDGAWYVIPK